MAGSRLQRAIVTGLAPGGDLAEALLALGDYPIATREDAECVCEALERFPLRGPVGGEYRITSPLHALLSLFQDAATEEAAEVFAERGVPELCRVFDESLETLEDDADVDALMFLLKILAMYRTYEGTLRVVAAARRPFRPDRFMWSVILGQYDKEHPHWRALCDQLRDPLPEGFLAVAYLDMANNLAIGGALTCHPFDTPAGVAQLAAWLTNLSPEEFSYAHSAAASLPFISPPARDALVSLAMDHPDTAVQMEAAWASARLGSEGGIKVLARYARDPRYSRVACQYLEELDRIEAIPRCALEEDFRAMAEMCHWLAHPNEFGRPPDDIEVYDRRELYWPPTGDRRRLWLLKYRYRAEEAQAEDEVGVGMVGSITFALFGEVTPDLSPEDVYALHCCWELECREDRRAPTTRSIEAGRRILARYNRKAGGCQ
jgi:hypothetical protein